MRKILAAIRFAYFKLFFKRFGLKGVSYIGKNVSISIGKNAQIICEGKIRLDDNAALESSGKIILGDHFVLNPFSRIVAHEEIRIGKNVVIARFVSILDHDHTITRENGAVKFSGYKTAPIRIGDNVWIGDKVTILKGVTIGDNVIIAANAVVTKNIQSNVVAGGIPARVLKEIVV